MIGCLILPRPPRYGYGLLFYIYMTNELLPFVKEALNKGLSRKEITDALLKASWKDDEIHQALNSFVDIDFPIPVPKRRPYTSAREAFLYLLLFLTLYISAWSFGVIVFQFINRWLPDVMQLDYVYDSTASALRMGTASLIVAFPLYLWISSILAKSNKRDSDKRNSKVRKWLTYITLFAAAGVIIGDTISIVFAFLQGDLTLRFVMKVFTIAGISGSIFGWYLLDLRSSEDEEKK
ncbi:hypothetical protein IT408_01670 [Candidatus Uhrbacteria bacterium]|nr:hypothetical protein [Candidatus Uhrbacteria bacterium]